MDSNIARWEQQESTRVRRLRLRPIFEETLPCRIREDVLCSLLDHRPPVEKRRKTGDRYELTERSGRQLRTRLGAMNQRGDAELLCRDQAALIVIHVERPCRIEP